MRVRGDTNYIYCDDELSFVIAWTMAGLHCFDIEANKLTCKMQIGNNSE